jgi:hypothetical protein
MALSAERDDLRRAGEASLGNREIGILARDRLEVISARTVASFAADRSVIRFGTTLLLGRAGDGRVTNEAASDVVGSQKTSEKPFSRGRMRWMPGGQIPARTVRIFGKSELSVAPRIVATDERLSVFAGAEEKLDETRRRLLSFGRLEPDLPAGAFQPVRDARIGGIDQGPRGEGQVGATWVPPKCLGVKTLLLRSGDRGMTRHTGRFTDEGAGLGCERVLVVVGAALFEWSQEVGASLQRRSAEEPEGFGIRPGGKDGPQLVGGLGVLSQAKQSVCEEFSSEGRGAGRGLLGSTIERDPQRLDGGGGVVEFVLDLSEEKIPSGLPARPRGEFSGERGGPIELATLDRELGEFIEEFGVIGIGEEARCPALPRGRSVPRAIHDHAREIEVFRLHRGGPPEP